MSTILVGSAPDSWGVWFPEDPVQTPYTRFLDEVAASGYKWIELGPFGYLPTDPKQLSDELASRDLKLSAGTVFEHLHQDDSWDAVWTQIENVAKLTAAVGGKHVVVIPEMWRDPATGAVLEDCNLTAEQWQKKTTGMNELGKAMFDDLVAQFRKACADAGVGIASVLPVLRWSGPDEDARQAAVRNWKRVVQITVDLGVNIINTEFSGPPERAEESERAFFRSMEELLPIFEREGIDVRIDPHPDDFVEDGLEALRIIRGVNSPISAWSASPATPIHMGGNMGEIIRGPATSCASCTWPTPWTTAAVMACATSPIRRAARRGCTSTSRSVTATSTGTSSSAPWPTSTSIERPDTVMVSSVFAEDENAHEVSRYQLNTMTEYVTKTEM